MDTPYLHQVPLRAMTPHDIARALHEGADSDLLHAVLHCLRDKHAEMTESGHSPPEIIAPGEHRTLASTAPTAAEYRAHYAGAATVLKELFFDLIFAGQKTGEEPPK